jgi:GntR family transcriptional regulator, transcriptional repressor for pyruvate dehydrogenase complex
MIDDLRSHIALPSERAERELLADGIARSVAKYIATSRVAAGQLLPSESALAHMFLVSTRTVREALRILAEQGIVRTSQGRRAVVSDWRSRAMKRSLEFARFLGKDSLTDLLELRFALEPRAAALAALRADSSDIQGMEDALKAMRTAGTEVDAWVMSDMKFHSAVVAASHNDFFSMVANALSDSLLEERRAGARGRLAQGRTPDRTLREHAGIANAISTRDAALAERRMLKHLQQSFSYFWGQDDADVYLPSRDKLTVP